jgi:ribonucleoside-diphosphate reductase alpha chain
MSDPANAAVSRFIWETRYRASVGAEVHDQTIEDTWRRVARAVAAAEGAGAERWAGRFFDLLAGFRFLPGGRILAGAGTEQERTLLNCFVMGVIEDSLSGIFEALKEGALTMQRGGGVGYDFSTLRPALTPARTSGAIASGPVSFLHVWDAMCATVLSTGARRGAMMATLRGDHPDVLAFLDAKAERGALQRLNLSLQVSDELMAAVRRGDDWPLVFPERALPPGSPGLGTVERWWTGGKGPVPCRVLAVLPARSLWERLTRAAYERADPGVLFVDRVNRANNLWYRERITATNPCGEVPLPPYGACDLGSINLTRYVEQPFTVAAGLDWKGIEETAQAATRFLDDVLDVSRYPLAAQEREARSSRRIGLGLTGLADALAMLGQRYGSAQSLETAGAIMRTITHAAYRASVELAREKGSFPAFDRDRYLAGEFVGSLPAAVQAGIAEHGIRNSHLTAIAPTGTVSLLAGNVSSGLEPIFDWTATRRVLGPMGEPHELEVHDWAVDLYRTLHPGVELPAELFVRARELAPETHLDVQAALQPYVDNAVAKTVNVAADCSLSSFASLFELAWSKGLKGCTAFRPNPVTGEVLSAAHEPASHCCVLEREAD